MSFYNTRRSRYISFTEVKIYHQKMRTLEDKWVISKRENQSLVSAFKVHSFEVNFSQRCEDEGLWTLNKTWRSPDILQSKACLCPEREEVIPRALSDAPITPIDRLVIRPGLLYWFNQPCVLGRLWPRVLTFSSVPRSSITEWMNLCPVQTYVWL